MASTPEAKVKKQVVKILQEEGVYYFFPVTGGYGRSGIPDIVGCLPGGRFLAIECKAEGNTLTALQTRELERILARGGAAFVVDEHSLLSLPGMIRLLKDK